MRSIVGEGRPCNNTQGWLRGALVSISPPRSPLDRRNLLCMVMRIIGLKMLCRGMTERSQTRNVWAPQRVERCGSHSDSVKISAPPAQLSLYSPFLLAVPYKAGIVGDMNATIQQNEINNAQRQDQRRLERMSLRAVPPSLPAYEVFVLHEEYATIHPLPVPLSFADSLSPISFIITSISFVRGHTIGTKPHYSFVPSPASF